MFNRPWQEVDDDHIQNLHKISNWVSPLKNDDDMVKLILVLFLREIHIFLWISLWEKTFFLHLRSSLHTHVSP